MYRPCIPTFFYGKKCSQNLCVCLCRDTRFVCPNSHPYRERASRIPDARTVRPYIFMENSSLNVYACRCRDTRFVCPSSHPYRERVSRIPGARTVRPCIFMENSSKMFLYADVGTHGSCVRATFGLGIGIVHTGRTDRASPTIFMENSFKMFAYACVGTHGSCV